MQSIYLRLSIIDGCNLRCTYCRPERDVQLADGQQVLDLDGLTRLVAWMDASVSLRKLRLTGGEPLLREDVIDLVTSLRQVLPRAELCLTTNGQLLSHYASRLQKAGLDRVNLSLDTLDADRYSALTRGGRLDRVLAGLEAAIASGLGPVKLNAVLLRTVNGRHLHELVAMAAERNCEIRFIELMPISVAAGLHRSEYLPFEEALRSLQESFKYLGPRPNGGTALRHGFEVDGREVTVGGIPSVSEPFCRTCDRLRLDCRGTLFPCLRRSDGLDLAGPLRNGSQSELRERVLRVLRTKCPPESVWPGRQMSAIGG